MDYYNKYVQHMIWLHYVIHKWCIDSEVLTCCLESLISMSSSDKSEKIFGTLKPPFLFSITLAWAEMGLMTNKNKIKNRTSKWQIWILNDTKFSQYEIFFQKSHMKKQKILKLMQRNSISKWMQSKLKCREKSVVFFTHLMIYIKIIILICSSVSLQKKCFLRSSYNILVFPIKL